MFLLVYISLCKNSSSVIVRDNSLRFESTEDFVFEPREVLEVCESAVLESRAFCVFMHCLELVFQSSGVGFGGKRILIANIHVDWNIFANVTDRDKVELIGLFLVVFYKSAVFQNLSEVNQLLDCGNIQILFVRFTDTDVAPVGLAVKL